jgi:hypothetical protein
MFDFKNPFKKEEKIPEKRKKPEDYIFNPLEVYCGDFVEVTTVEDTFTCNVSEIIEHSRYAGGNLFKHTDYKLEDTGKIWDLRLNSKINFSEVKSPQDCDMLLMKIFYEGEFDEGIQDAAKCKEFIKTNEDGSQIIFEALKSGKEGWNSSLKIIKSDGSEDRRNIKYWDFFREADIKLNELFSGQVFLFVEIDQSDGFITMWEGHQILNSDIKTYHKS